MQKKYRTQFQQVQALAAQLTATSDNVDEDTVITALEPLLAQVIHDTPAQLDTVLRDLQLPRFQQPRHRQLIDYYQGLALGLNEQYHTALTALRTLLEIPNLDERVRARTLNSCAIFQRITGQLQAAIDSYQASLTLWTKLDDSLNMGKVHVNLGILAYQLQEYANAEEHLTNAATCFTVLGNRSRLAAVWNELGLIYRDQGRWTEALTCFDDAIEQRRQEGAAHDLGIALNNRGEVLLLQGDLVGAAAAFTEALEQMAMRVYMVDVHLNLGLVHLAAGDLTAAHAAFLQAETVALTIERRDVLALVYYRLGDLLQRMGQRTEANHALESAVSIIEATRDPITSEGLKISLLGRWQQIYEALVLLSLEMGGIDNALVWAERARARAFAELVAERQQGQPDLSNQRTLYFDGTVRQERVHELQSALLDGDQVFCYFTTGVLDRSEPFLRLLPHDHPLRPYLLPPARTLLFLLNSDDVSCITCPVDPNAFTSNMQRPTDRSRFFAPRVRTGLYQMLLAEAIEQKSRAVPLRRLYLIPHGPLHGIPFAALRGPANLHHDNRRQFTRIYAPSLLLLSNHLHTTRPPQEQPIRTLVVSHAGANQQLRHAEAEGVLVAALTDGKQWPLINNERDKNDQQNLAQAAATVNWLHLACHGWFDPDAPLDSYVEIADGERLTAREILDTWQLHAQLVTLSACQTGVSRILRGDEPMGLIRAFLAAGARMVLATQWPVADLPTYLLMGRFYLNLTGNLTGNQGEGYEVDPAAALHEAQQWLQSLTSNAIHETLLFFQKINGKAVNTNLSTEFPTGPHPFASPQYWAGFTLFVG